MSYTNFPFCLISTGRSGPARPGPARPGNYSAFPGPALYNFPGRAAGPAGPCRALVGSFRAAHTAVPVRRPLALSHRPRLIKASPQGRTAGRHASRSVHETLETPAQCQFWNKASSATKREPRLIVKDPGSCSS